jgi:hypothetical protein
LPPFGGARGDSSDRARSDYQASHFPIMIDMVKLQNLWPLIEAAIRATDATHDFPEAFA